MSISIPYKKEGQTKTTMERLPQNILMICRLYGKDTGVGKPDFKRIQVLGMEDVVKEYSPHLAIELENSAGDLKAHSLTFTWDEKANRGPLNDLFQNQLSNGYIVKHLKDNEPSQTSDCSDMGQLAKDKIRIAACDRFIKFYGTELGKTDFKEILTKFKKESAEDSKEQMTKVVDDLLQKLPHTEFSLGTAGMNGVLPAPNRCGNAALEDLKKELKVSVNRNGANNKVSVKLDSQLKMWPLVDSLATETLKTSLMAVIKDCNGDDDTLLEAINRSIQIEKMTILERFKNNEAKALKARDVLAKQLYQFKNLFDELNKREYVENQPDLNVFVVNAHTFQQDNGEPIISDGDVELGISSDGGMLNGNDNFFLDKTPGVSARPFDDLQVMSEHINWCVSIDYAKGATDLEWLACYARTRRTIMLTNIKNEALSGDSTAKAESVFEELKCNYGSSEFDGLSAVGAFGSNLVVAMYGKNEIAVGPATNALGIWAVNDIAVTTASHKFPVHCLGVPTVVRNEAGLIDSCPVNIVYEVTTEEGSPGFQYSGFSALDPGRSSLVDKAVVFDVARNVRWFLLLQGQSLPATTLEVKALAKKLQGLFDQSQKQEKNSQVNSIKVDIDNCRITTMSEKQAMHMPVRIEMKGTAIHYHVPISFGMGQAESNLEDAA